jgi:hypothetical protein
LKVLIGSALKSSASYYLTAVAFGKNNNLTFASCSADSYHLTAFSFGNNNNLSFDFCTIWLEQHHQDVFTSLSFCILKRRAFQNAS